HMGWCAAESLLANQPHSICNFVYEAALALKTLGQNQALQHGAPPKAVGLKTGSIAVALEIKKRSCQQRFQPAFRSESARPTMAVRISSGTASQGPRSLQFGYGCQAPAAASLISRKDSVYVLLKRLCGAVICWAFCPPIES